MSLWLGSWGCQAPFRPGQKLIRSIWTDGKQFEIVLAPQAQQLSDVEYPLTLTVGTMHVDASLPKQGDRGSHSLTVQSEHFETLLKIPHQASEAGIVLRDKRGTVLDRVALVYFPPEAILLRDQKSVRLGQKKAWEEQQKYVPFRRTKTTISRLRAVYSDAAFSNLAKVSGQQGLSVQEVKVLVDLHRDALPHFINSKQFDLHYAWVRELIEKKRRLNRCDPEENKEFNQGWVEFSNQNYIKTDTRRYYLATLIRYPGMNVYSLELSPGDYIKYHQLVETYRVLQNSFHAPIQVRPVTAEQKKELFHTNADKIPLMATDAPYKGQNVQLLSPGVAFGVLTALSKTEVASHPLGLRVIALLKDVPNDINFAGGIISTHFQSALSHINVLSRNRGTPHLVLKNALTQEKTKKLIGKLVRLEVTDKSYTLREASQHEAQAFWDKRSSQYKPWSPTRNITHKKLVDLSQSSYQDSHIIGAKAANLAELMKVHIDQSWHGFCRAFSKEGTVRTPDKPFGIPFYWYAEHIQRAGYTEKIKQWHKEDVFLKDSAYRAKKLEALRKAILETQVNPELMKLLQIELPKRYGDRKVRFRSSTNVEDLPNFNGAGLYTSKSGRLGDPKKNVEHALRTVWASLWVERAWNERQFYKIDHTQAAMGILVHPSFPDESANGVAISTNIFDSSNSSDTYIVVQKGEVSIVNPTGNTTPDQFLIRWYENPELLFTSYSNINHGQPVLSKQESVRLGCYMQAIHSHFQPHFSQPKKPFAMDVEFKIDGPQRQLYIKQARPYVFGEHQKPEIECKERP